MRSKHLIRLLALVLVAILASMPALAENTIKLPSGLKVIQAEAFRGVRGGKFILSEGVQQIGTGAFTGVDVTEINLPKSLTLIADSAFESEPGRVTVPAGSYAYNWCVARGWAPVQTKTASFGVNQATLNAREHVLFSYTVPTTGNYKFYSASGSDTYGILYDSNGNVLARDDDGGAGMNFGISYSLTAGQKVSLEAYFYSSTLSGSFSVYIDRVRTASTGANQTALNAGEHRWYTFTAPSAGTYTFCSTGSLDTYGILYDTSGNTIEQNDDGGDNSNFSLTHTMTSGEKVTLEVYLYSTAITGSFPVNISRSSATTTYRALIIGNVYDNNSNISTLTCCDGDRTIMTNLLNQSVTGTRYQVTTRRNLTASQILSAIPTAFSGADSNSVSLFFYSGHGFSTSGYLVGTDGSGVSFAQLKSALDAIPGKKIVILDSCFSGQAIGKSAGDALEAEDITVADLDAFNQSVINAFASGSSESTEKSGELAASNYYVMTAASKSQTSIGYSSYSLFTLYLAMGSGWNGRSSTRLSTLYADTNGDNKITLNEAYTKTEEYVAEIRASNSNVTQRTQVYPTNSSFVIWGR